MSRTIAFMGALLFCFHDAQVASATSIGVNFTATSFGGGPYPILPNESAGIVPQQNWNNTNPVANGLTADIASPVAGNVVDSTGAVTAPMSYGSTPTRK